MSISRYIFGPNPWPTFDVQQIEMLVRWDQMAATRKSVLVALRINAILGATILLVSWHFGTTLAGLAWFAASCAANLARFLILRRPPNTADCPDFTESRLRWAWVSALASGLVWAAIPALCEGYTGAGTLFYLVVVCGTTAGAITHGTAYARVPICFITPPLLSIVACLLYAGSFDQICLAGTVLLYTVALVRSARQTEASFREFSTLKNNATQTAAFLQGAFERSQVVAADMQEQATHDELTGLLNRRGLIEEAGRRQGRGRQLCVMLLDLDGFKAVNDSFGHQTGDRLLREIGERLRHSLPPSAALARLGGDEFAVLLNGSEDLAAPVAIANTLIAVVSRPFEALEACRIGVSVGIRSARDLPLEDLISGADEALYEAKNAGRNCIRIFDTALERRFDMRRDIERELPQAIADRQIELWFQPIVRDGGLRIVCVEALLRWNHPVYGFIPPADIVEEAARSGCSESLLAFTLERACDFAECLQHVHAATVPVAINISPREMSRLPIDEIILTTLAGRALDHAAIEIELTEEAALDIPVVQDKIAILTRAGLRISIDDFGAGYSSLASLRALRVDKVKVDRSFVTGLSRNESSRALLKAILMLGHSIGFDVVAEGVETEDDMVALQLLGCDAMQGFLFHRPMPFDDALALMSDSLPVLPGLSRQQR